MSQRKCEGTLAKTERPSEEVDCPVCGTTVWTNTNGTVRAHMRDNDLQKAKVKPATA